MLNFLIVCLLAWGIQSQPAQLICFQSADQDMSDIDLIKLEAVDMMTQEMSEMNMSGISEEEYTSMMTGMIDKTFVTMVQEQDKDNTTIGPFVTAILEGMMEMPDMMEVVMKTYIEQPTNFAMLLGTIVSNIDFECNTQGSVVVMQALSAMASRLSKQASKEQLADILVQSGISIATMYNITDNWSTTLEAIISVLPDTMDRLLVFDELIIQVLSEVILDIDFENSAEIAGIVSDIFVGIIDEYSLGGDELLSYLRDIFSRILEGFQ